MYSYSSFENGINKTQNFFQSTKTRVFSFWLHFLRNKIQMRHVD